MNANKPMIWKFAMRMVKFVILLAVLIVTAPLTLPYAAWSVSGEDD